MEIEIQINEKFLPRHDLIFSIMFEDVYLFTLLLKAVTGHQITTEKVYSQASVTPENIFGSYIRFDNFSSDEKDGTLYSLDLQNTYAEELLKNRTIFYACRGLSGQKVIKGNYQDLNKVVVSFIMTKKTNEESIEIINLYNQNHEKYSDLLTLYNVYVPSVLEHNDTNDDLKVFAAFFSVESYEDMVSFYNDYIDNPLATELILLYNKAIGREDLENLAEREYFKMKITEQDIAEAKIEYEAKGEAKGRAKGRAEGKIEGILMTLVELVKDGILTLSEAAKRAHMSVEEFELQTGLKA